MFTQLTQFFFSVEKEHFLSSLQSSCDLWSVLLEAYLCSTYDYHPPQVRAGLRIIFENILSIEDSCQYLHCRNMTLEKEIFPAATDSRFIRAVSICTDINRRHSVERHRRFFFLHSSCSAAGYGFVFCVCCRWVSQRLAFPQWTGRQSCCTITTSSWMSKSSWKASMYLSGSSRLSPAFLPVLMRLRQVLISNPLRNTLHGWSEYWTWIICRDYQRKVPYLS